MLLVLIIHCTVTLDFHKKKYKWKYKTQSEDFHRAGPKMYTWRKH